MTDKSHSAVSVTIPEPDRKQFVPGPDLQREVRAAFVMRKEKPRTLHAWCMSQDPPVAWATANAALTGFYDSDEIRAIRERILIAAGLITPEER